VVQDLVADGMNIRADDTDDQNLLFIFHNRTS
jgi:hypothetical protein